MSEAAGPEKRDKGPFWSSLAGMITAIAALLGTIIAGLGLWFSGANDESKPTAPIAANSTNESMESSAGPSSGLGATGTPSAAAKATPAKASGEVAWEKEVLLSNGAGINIGEAGPERVEKSGAITYGYPPSLNVSQGTSARLLPWKAASKPSKSDCQNLISTFGTGDTYSGSGDVGSNFCILSAEGQYLTATFVKVNEYDRYSMFVKFLLWK